MTDTPTGAPTGAPTGTPTDRFRALHVPGHPLLCPNPWDLGSARVLVSLGFAALATTSSGFAATLGRPDGHVSREEAIAHAAAVAETVQVPVTADLENGFGADPAAAARTAGAARAAGLAGFSIEDATGDSGAPVFELGRARERVEAAAEAAHAAGGDTVLTARAENYLYGRADLADTIARLQAFQEAGADVLYAPGLTSVADIRSMVESVDRPVNVLLLATGPAPVELAELGVARITVGGAFAYAALGALAEIAEGLRTSSIDGLWTGVQRGRAAARAAFG